MLALLVTWTIEEEGGMSLEPGGKPMHFAGHVASPAPCWALIEVGMGVGETPAREASADFPAM